MILLISGFKFYNLFNDNLNTIKKHQTELTAIQSDRDKAKKSYDLVSSFTLEGYGENLKVSVPSLITALYKEMPLHAISGNITAEKNKDAVKLFPIPITNGKSQFIKLKITGSYKDYHAFLAFVNKLDVSGLVINKISMHKKINFELIVSVVGY